MFKPVVAQLQQEGHIALIYSDNMLLLGRTKTEVQNAVLAALQLVTKLGVTVNWPKSNWRPARKSKFLGQEINLESRSVSLPASKVKDYSKRIVGVLRRTTTTPRELASVAGQALDAAKGETLLLGLAKNLSHIATTKK